MKKMSSTTFESTMIAYNDSIQWCLARFLTFLYRYLFVFVVVSFLPWLVSRIYATKSRFYLLNVWLQAVSWLIFIRNLAHMLYTIRQLCIQQKKNESLKNKKKKKKRERATKKQPPTTQNCRDLTDSQVQGVTSSMLKLLNVNDHLSLSLSDIDKQDIHTSIRNTHHWTLNERNALFSHNNNHKVLINLLSAKDITSLVNALINWL